MKTSTFKGKVGTRFYQENANKAIRSTWDIIKELVTNVDDSYQRMHISELKLKNKNITDEQIKNSHWEGDCQIYIDRGGKKNSTFFMIKDKAEGFDEKNIEKKLATAYGEHTAGEASRGFFNKGLKDIAYKFPLNIYSQKNETFIHAHVDFRNAKGSEDIGDVTVHTYQYKEIPDDKKQYLSLKKNRSGTTIILEIPADVPNFTNTKFSSIEKNLANHFTLSRMLTAMPRKNLNLTLHSSMLDKKGKVIEHFSPKGELVIDEKWDLNKYAKEFNCSPTVEFKVWKSPESLISQEHEKEFKRWGISILGHKACYEKNLFGDTSLNNNPVAKQYFGYLQSELIDASTELFKNPNPKPTKLNPSLISDSNRLEGLDRKHPLTRDLYEKAIKFLKKHIKETTTDKIQITESTKKMLEKLADFMNEELTKDEIAEKDEKLVSSILPGEFIFIPKVNKIYSGESINLYVYTDKESLIENITTGTLVSSDKNNDFIKIHNLESELKINENNKARFKFTIEGIKPSLKDINLAFYYGKKETPKKQTSILVEDYKDRNFIELIEFDNKTGIYNVKENGSSVIKVFAKFPDLLDKREEFDINYSNPGVVNGPNKVTLERFKNTNYAKGEFKIHGRILNSNTDFSVNFKNLTARAKINVTEKKSNINPFSIDYKKEDFRNDRYQWNPTNQNNLWLGCEHEQLKQYFGNVNENGSYENEEASCTRAVVAEVVADAISKLNIVRKYRSIDIDEINHQDVLSDLSIDKSRIVVQVHKLIGIK